MHHRYHEIRQQNDVKHSSAFSQTLCMPYTDGDEQGVCQKLTQSTGVQAQSHPRFEQS